MAHYAHVDTANANTVTKVIVISNEEEGCTKIRGKCRCIY
jgi:hypothetical protein